jgi:hypothetical protein
MGTTQETDPQKKEEKGKEERKDGIKEYRDHWKKNKTKQDK